MDNNGIGHSTMGTLLFVLYSVHTPKYAVIGPHHTTILYERYSIIGGLTVIRYFVEVSVSMYVVVVA